MAIGTRVLDSQTTVSGLCNICGAVAKPAYTCNICGSIVCLSCFHHNIGACKKCVKGRFGAVSKPSSSLLRTK